MLRTSRSTAKSLRHIAFASALAAALCSCATDTASVAGTLDPGFGNRGRVGTGFGSPADGAVAVAIEFDGRIVVAGSTQDPVHGNNFAIVRYTAGGNLDRSFGDGGKVSTDFGGRSDTAAAVVSQPDGKILVAGTSQGADTGEDIALARYTPEGNPDTGFGAGGKVRTDLGTPADRGNALALQPDGRIVVAGSSRDPVQGDNFALVRYTPDGKPDPSFGDGGRVSTDFGGKSDVAAAVTVLSDGRILAVGTTQGATSGDDIALARYTPDGKLDTGFGTDGKVSTDLGTQADRGNAVAVQTDGRIIVAGSTQDPAHGDDFAVLRYTPDGKLDPGFGDAGKATTDFGGKSDSARAVAIQADGKIVVVGTSHGAGDNIAIARYTTDGKPDTGFGDNGRVSTDPGGRAEHGNGVAIQPDGRIVVAGSTGDPAQGIVVLRYRD
ncbi:hypothetical protein [Nocardia arthritidis]|uniref:Delta-60 repeat protein n=1 Tax=Nocardia arthritidis TaxID=228602 RepID=A0A6G9Y8Q6_9NOCA|nr:hypothetical protein [Nocardia arthritidis]QIS09599.1 hypothetical protein F5544_08485 [Nocardia arthritidis]